MGRTIVTRVSLSESDMHAASEFASIDATESYGLRKFPIPEQYHERVAQLAARNIVSHPTVLYVLAQRDWHIRGQTGCMFARLAACQSISLRWEYIVVDYTAGSDRACLESVSHYVRDAVCDDQVEIFSVLFPLLREPSDVETMVRDLAAHTSFWLERNEVVHGYRRLHLRYPVSTGPYPVQAWVMAFAPFSFQPNTRRGPYVELTIRVKKKPEWIFHRLNQDRNVAHLADVPLEMTEPHWEHRWQSTLRRTRMILGGEPDEISAAKCTFAVPINYKSVLYEGQI